jgi:hypothetical protein
MLQGTKEYYIAKEKLDTLYQAKLKEKRQKELDEFKRTYESRIKTHENTITQLESKEKDLSDKIVNIQKDLANKLKTLEDERVHTIENIESKIHNIQLSNATDYQKFVDKKRQSEIALSKAKAKLKIGDLQEAKRYMSQYESLVSGLANTEIKENGKVVVSKQQSNQLAINGLKQLEGLENGYFAKKKQEEITLHNQKINQLKAQLEATKAQLQMEVQRLNLEKQLIELTTGKKVDIDTSSALNSIKNLDKQIKLLDNQIKTPKKANIDNTEAISKINQVKQTYGNLTLNGKTIKITADTTPADFGISSLISKVDGYQVKMEVNPEYQKAEEKIKQAIQNFEQKPIETEIKADTDTAQKKVTSFKDIADNPVNFEVNADDTEAKKTIDILKKPISTTLTIKANAVEVLKVIEKLKQNTTSTHTIRVREVKQKALGGLIEPIKLATGGNTNFTRKSGRIAGYDPTDSDDVPALLTRGEFVIKRDAVKHYGDDFLYRLNNKSLPKYATGGLVEAGKPQKLITELGNSATITKDNNVDLSKLDEFIEKLKELLQTFTIGGATQKVDEIQSELTKTTNLKDKITKDMRKYSDYKSSTNGKTLNEKEYKQYESKLKKLDKTEIDKKLEKNLETELSDFVSKMELYLKQVDVTKGNIRNTISKYGFSDYKILPDNFDNMLDLDSLNKMYKKYSVILKQAHNFQIKIKSKLKKLGINESEVLPSDFNDVYDVSRLGRFYNKLNKLHPLNSQTIQERFTKEAQKYLQSYRAIYNRPGANQASYLFLPKPPSGNSFVHSLGIRDSGLAKKYDNIFKYNIDPRKYDNNQFQLGDEIKNTTIQDYLKQHLPRFKNGGAIDGLNGGKLNGYGGGDRNLALLEDGEFIIRKEAVSNYGVELLHKLNNFKLPKFATGGYVGSMPSNSSAPSDLVNVNFNLPNGKSYGLQGSEEISRMLASDLKRMM